MSFKLKPIIFLVVACLAIVGGSTFAEDAQNPVKEEGEAVLGQEDSPAPLVKGGESLPGHDEMGCMACHKTTPKSLAPADKTPLLTEDLNSLCRRCHDIVSVVREGHHLEPTPFAEEELVLELKKMNLPMAKGGISCITCHEPHGKPHENFLLKAAYSNFVEKSKWINPHWNENLCLACHLKKPEDSAKLYFKFDSDFIKMCNICHDMISGQKLIHSVGMVPSQKIKEKIPKNFLLSKNDEVTCITCHELKYQCLKKEFERKKMNPLFFRSGPYGARTDLCYKCHDPGEYERLNPHDQITDEGELIADRCLYCHSEVPNPKTDGIKQVKFQLEANLKALCQRCHRDRPHPGGSLARPKFNHIVKPSKATLEWKKKAEKKKDVALNLEPNSGKIFCCTCHNPHERGIQARPAAEKGSDNKQRLRLNDGYDLCESCHGWNK